MMRFLVVEPDDYLRNALMEHISDQMDRAIIIAKDSEEAHIILSNAPVDLILTDIAIRNTNGGSFLVYIRQHYPHVPVILSSTLIVAEVDRKLQQKGFTGLQYLQKPLSPDTYLQVVLQHLESIVQQKSSISNVLPTAIDRYARLSSRSQFEHNVAYSMQERINMATIQQSLDAAMAIDGAIATALVDYESGMALGMAGGGTALNLEVAAAGNTNVIRAKMRVMQELNLHDEIEDILITLGNQYHLIRLLRSSRGLFLYLVLGKAQANLALARHKLSQIEAQLSV